MSSGRRQTTSNDISTEAIENFLDANPDFFESHPQLVAKLRIPHKAGEAVSLIEKQVEILRAQNRTLERKLVDLIEVARANDASVERIHQLVLGVIESDDLADLLHGLQDKLRHRFGADAATLLLFTGDKDKVEFGPARRIDRDSKEMSDFQHMLKTGQPIVGRLRPSQLEMLFAEEAPRIGSAALLPLGDNAGLGLLAIGAHSEDQFGPTLGTTFLMRISEILTAAIRRRLHD